MPYVPTQFPLSAIWPIKCGSLIISSGFHCVLRPVDLSAPISSFQNSYYDLKQREIIPECVRTPNPAQDVADAIKIIRQRNCIFIIKSGGHNIFLGASNTPGGITFDMKNLNDVRISEDLETTRIGTGNRWWDVYKVMARMNRTVIGGRNTDVGVGWSLLGGESTPFRAVRSSDDCESWNKFPLRKVPLGCRQHKKLRSKYFSLYSLDVTLKPPFR